MILRLVPLAISEQSREEMPRYKTTTEIQKIIANKEQIRET